MSFVRSTIKYFALGHDGGYDIPKCVLPNALSFTIFYPFWGPMIEIHSACKLTMLSACSALHLFDRMYLELSFDLVYLISLIFSSFFDFYLLKSLF